METAVRVFKDLWPGLLFGCRMVSPRAAPSSRPDSTGFAFPKSDEDHECFRRRMPDFQRRTESHGTCSGMCVCEEDKRVWTELARRRCYSRGMINPC